MTRLPRSSEGTNVDAFSGGDWGRFLSVSTIWGSSFLFIAYALEGFAPGPITLIRVGLGAGWLWLARRARRTVDRGDWPRLVLLSFTWVAIPFTVFPIAQQWINSALAGMLNGATPIAAGLIAWLMLGRRPGTVQLVGLGLGLVGILLMGLPALDGGSQALGIALVLGVTVLYGISVNVAVPLLQRYGSVPVMARLLALGTLWTIPFGAVGWDDVAPAWPAIASVVVLGVVGTGIAFGLMADLTASVGSTRASFITYVIPVVALVLGVVFRGDAVAPLALVGVAAVVSGSVLASRPDRSAPR